MNKFETTGVVLISAVIVLIFSLASAVDYQEALDQNDRYCRMTAIYKMDSSKGWPPYDASINCKKESNNEH